MTSSDWWNIECYTKSGTKDSNLLSTPILHNFVSQLATWRGMIGKGVLVGHVRTHIYQLQLAMWRVMAQNCAKIGVPSISHF